MTAAPKKVNIQAKNQLARLLASENVWIQHRKVATASFDLVSRILTFPIWKDMSDALYTMLAGHECGHAIWSERASVIDIGKRIDPKNPYLAGTYWNIVEDARIERMIKTMYPGLVRTFAQAYQELFDKDMFGLAGKDPNKMSFADRINLHFKVGHLLNLSFTPQEQVFVDKVDKTVTADEVVAVSKEIYEFAKHQQLQPPPMSALEEMLEEMLKQKKQQQQGGGNDDEDSEDEDDDGSGMSESVPIFSEDGSGEPTDDPNVEPSDNAPKGKPKKSAGTKGKKKEAEGKDKGDQGKDKADKGKDKGKEDTGKGDKGKEDSDDGEGDGSDGEADSGEGKDKGPSGKPEAGKDASGVGKDKGKVADGKIPGTGKEALKPVDPGPPPEPTTQRTFDEKLLEYNDKNAMPVEYITLPKPNIKNIVVDFTDVHPKIRKHDFSVPVRSHWDYSPRVKMTAAEIKKLNDEHWAKATQAFEDFRKENKPKIDYVHQQFEMKKQAERYKRTRQHKTGSVDPLRLWAYKTEEDLFKTIAIVTDAKNHGLIFVVDWSASMSSSMAGTLEQLIMLCMFCRKANIPFDVYSLTTGSRNAFSREPGNMVYADIFRMRCYLSSRMSSSQFYEACVNLFALMPGGSFHGGPTDDNLIGCTPLDEAIITTIELIKTFRDRTKAQVVNAIFMTDGDANTVQGYIDAKGKEVDMNNRTRYLIDDRSTHKVYDFVKAKMTPTMLEILRDRQNINVVGFYIGGHWRGFFDDLDDVQTKALEKQFSESGFVIATAWGYNELYITSSGERWKIKSQKIRPQKIEKGTDKYEEALQKNFIDQRKASLKQRVMLDRFVLMIA